jgi:hypothetical protein
MGQVRQYFDNGAKIATMAPDNRYALSFPGLSLAIAAVAAVGIAASLKVPARQEFEVAFIPKNNSGPPAVWVNPFVFSPGGRFTATNVTLPDVIVMAYGTRRIQMQGGRPGSIRKDSTS